MGVVDIVIPERWAPIAGYPGHEVSDRGRVRSNDRTEEVPCRWGGTMKRRHRGKVLKTWLVNSGYEVVALGFDRDKRAYVHRLVAEAFVPRAEGKPEVNHRNGDKRDNSAVNLEWASRSDQMWHSTHVLGHRGGQFRAAANA